MKKFNEITVNLRLSIGYSVAQQEETVYLHDYILEEEWGRLNLFEKDDFIHNEILNEWANVYIESSAELNED